MMNYHDYGNLDASCGTYAVYDYGYGGNIGGGMMTFGWLFMVFLWILVIASLVSLVRWAFRGAGFERHFAPSHKKHSASLDIIEERYARGEIGRVEFEEKKA